jgi:hypothetical protein
VILPGELDPADTIKPRLEAAGAYLSRVIILDGCVRHADDSGCAISLKADVNRFGATLAEVADMALVVIDPITAYLGDVDEERRDMRLANTVVWPGDQARNSHCRCVAFEQEQWK